MDKVNELVDHANQTRDAETSAAEAAAAAAEAAAAAAATTKAMNQLNGAVRHCAIYPCVSGKVAVISDADTQPIDSLSVYGQTVQAETPSLDNPSELVTTPYGDLTVRVYGKNMAAGRYINNVTETTQGGAACWVSGITSDRENCLVFNPTGTMGPITISARVMATAETLCLDIKYSDATTISTFEKAGVNWGNIEFTTEAGRVVEEIRIGSHNTDITVWVDKESVMIHPGEVAIEYESPKDLQTIPLGASYKLHGVPVSSGGNFTDSNGQQWITNEIDLASGKFIQRVHELVLTSSTTFDKTETLGTYRRVVIETGAAATGTKYCTDAMSSHLPLKYDYSGDNLHYYVKGETAYIFIPVDETWLANNTVRILYPLAVPGEVDLSSSIMDAFSALRLNSGDNIITVEGADFRCTYRADNDIFFG